MSLFRMLLNELTKGMSNAIKSLGENDGNLENACNTFLNSFIPEVNTGTLCSLVGGMESKMQNILDDLNLDDLSSIMDSIKSE